MPFNHPYGMILDEIQALVAAYIFGVNKDNSIDG